MPPFDAIDRLPDERFCMTDIAWSLGAWLHEPPLHSIVGPDLVVTTADKSNFWRQTGYGFTQYSGHALLVDFPSDTAMELEFSFQCRNEFDQAGIFLHADDQHWVKPCVEFADGVLGLGAVVTDRMSDWSVGHIPE